MLMLFGKRMNPVARVLLGAAFLVIGIVVHLELLAILSAAYLVFAAVAVARNVRRNAR
jgi:threonine/homoserine/homoserine lactone efflux protein